MNLGHAQSVETKKKIAAGVRQGWERRRGFLMVQESCLHEWQNNIAESSRKGYAGELELQWDSHEIMTEQLKQLWLESIEKRKSMLRPKGSKRAPKSMEQRRKISEAISAKWADPEYRNRVHAALAKYHGSTRGNERKARRRSTGGTLPEKKVSNKKKPAQTAPLNCEEKGLKQLTYRRRKNSAPSYKDPMSCANLELLKKVKAERAEIEAKKRAATMRAKLLIAEAERAAEALEVAALKSPLAKASLLETRRLIAEATLSIQSIESGHLMSQGTPVEPYFDSDFDGSRKLRNEQLVNGFHTLCSAGSIVEMNGSEMPPLQSKNDRTETVALDTSDLVSRKLNDSKNCAIRRKKWVCGRLVEVDE